MDMLVWVPLFSLAVSAGSLSVAVIVLKNSKAKDHDQLTNDIATMKADQANMKKDIAIVRGDITEIRSNLAYRKEK